MAEGRKSTTRGCQLSGGSPRATRALSQVARSIPQQMGPAGQPAFHLHTDHPAGEADGLGSSGNAPSTTTTRSPQRLGFKPTEKMSPNIDLSPVTPQKVTLKGITTGPGATSPSQALGATSRRGGSPPQGAHRLLPPHKVTPPGSTRGHLERFTPFGGPLQSQTRLGPIPPARR